MENIKSDGLNETEDKREEIKEKLPEEASDDKQKSLTQG